MTKQVKTNNLNYFIDPTFSKANKLFVLSFENEDDRTSFSKYYTPSVKIKDFNILIDGKSFFDVPIKTKKENMLAILKWIKLITKQMVVYYIMNTFQSIIN